MVLLHRYLVAARCKKIYSLTAQINGPLITAVYQSCSMDAHTCAIVSIVAFSMPAVNPSHIHTCLLPYFHSAVTVDASSCTHSTCCLKRQDMTVVNLPLGQLYNTVLLPIVQIGFSLLFAGTTFKCCRVVGWYHSHPTFATFPSMIDIANQVTQQNAHKTATCEPYIAAIVGPYNKKLTTCQSSMTWFYVHHEAGRIPAEDENPLQAGCTPMELQVQS